MLKTLFVVATLAVCSTQVLADEVILPDALQEVVARQLSEFDQCDEAGPVLRLAEADAAVVAHCDGADEEGGVAFSYEVTLFFSRPEAGDWQFEDTRSINTFTNPFARPTYAEFQALSVQEFAESFSDDVMVHYPKLTPEALAEQLRDGIGLAFADTAGFEEWYRSYDPQLNDLRDLLLEKREADPGYKSHSPGDLEDPASRLISAFGFHRCDTYPAGPLSDVWDPSSPDFDCVIQFVPGDNYVGLFWASGPDRTPPVTRGHYFYIWPLGEGWYAYRST